MVGWDSARLAMILAVLDARCGLALAQHDVYLNVAGGFQVREPAADLAVAAALISSVAARPSPRDVLYFGEIGLAGEVRPVHRADSRLAEAAKLGFARAVAPASDKRRRRDGIAIEPVDRLARLVDLIHGNDGRG